MRIALGSDHRGFNVKQKVADLLRRFQHEVVDVGTYGQESVDYPDVAAVVGAKVSRGEVDRGILICGTGIGMSISANKVAGVRAALCRTEFEARMARAHNDANVLCLGQRVTGAGLARAVLEAFLAQSFEGGRHQSRVDKIRSQEGH